MKTKIRTRKKVWLVSVVVTGIIAMCYGIIFLFLGHIPSIEKIIFLDIEINLPFVISKLWDLPIIFVFTFLIIKFIFYIKKKNDTLYCTKDNAEELFFIFIAVFLTFFVIGFVENIIVNVGFSGISFNLFRTLISNMIVMILACFIAMLITSDYTEEFSEAMIVFGVMLVSFVGFNFGFVLEGGVIVNFIIILF